jgi:adhesin transport system outer membrane protein
MQSQFKKIWTIVALILSSTQMSIALAESQFEQALRTALSRNPAISGKQAEVSVVDFAVSGEKAAWLPTVSTQIDDTDPDFTRGLVRVDQPLWSFGKIKSRVAAAESDVLVEEADLLNVQRKLIQRTASAYATVKVIEARIAVANADLKAHTDLLAHVTRRSEKMMASETDVSLANSRLLLSKVRLSRLGGQLRQAQSQLRSLTIDEVPTDEVVPKELLRLPETDLALAVLDASAEVASKKAALQSAKNQISVAKTASYPTLMLRGEHEMLDNPIEGGRDSWVGLVMVASLDGLGRVRSSGVGSAKARYQAKLDDLAVTKHELERQVASLLSDLETARSLNLSQHAVIGSLQDTLDSYYRQYNSGFKSWLDLLNMQRELTEQQLQLAEIENQETQASISLQAMMGGFDRLAGSQLLSEQR